jgi:hypothetical protein
VRRVTYCTSRRRKSVVIASAETLQCCSRHSGPRTGYIIYMYIILLYYAVGLRVDFYECAHTQCFCKRSGGGEYINAYAVCVIHRGRKQMFSQPVFGSPTRRLLRYCTTIVHYMGCCCRRGCTVAGTAFLRLKSDDRARRLHKNRYASAYIVYRLYLRTPRLWYNTLCTSYNNIIRVYSHTLSSYNAALGRNILISYIYYIIRIYKYIYM